MNANARKEAGVTIVLCIALLFGAAVFSLYVGPAVRISNPTAALGTKLPKLGGYNWSSHPTTLVLALHVGCPHCENNMGFYRQLVDLEHQEKTPAHVVAAYPDSRREVQESLDAERVKLDFIPDVDFRKLKVLGTPTLFLVDNEGIVRSTWVGELAEQDQAEVLRAISKVIP